jgi:geranylgeranyl reductase family protein
MELSPLTTTSSTEWTKVCVRLNEAPCLIGYIGQVPESTLPFITVLNLKIAASRDCDVLISGGGPAGAAAAAHLAAAGISVVLADQQGFPRDKVCGDFVGPAALLELQSLGITNLLEYQRTNVIRNASLYLNGRRLITHPLPRINGMPSNGRVIPRKALDEWIINAARTAGATIIENTRVQDFETTAEGVTVVVKGEAGLRKMRARALIGADGSNSLIARRMRGHQVPDKDRIIAMRCYFEGIVNAGDTCDLYFSDDTFPGYYWLFPTGPNSANVGIGMVRETLPQSDAHLRDLMLRRLSSDPALRARVGNAQLQGRIVGWPLTTYNSALDLVDDRVLLVGDAAGLINPLNGEGIQYAMLSGRWAAETLLTACLQDDFSRATLQCYSRRVECELRLDMALARMIVQMIRNRHLTPVWLRALQIIAARANADARYAEITGGVLAGLVPARRVMRLDIVRKTCQQAVLALSTSAAVNLLRGPAHVARLGAGTIRTAAGVVLSMGAQPGAATDWGLGVAGSALELAAECALARPAAVRVSSQAHPLTVAAPAVRIGLSH